MYEQSDCFDYAVRQRTLPQLAEPSPHGVEPRRARRREVHVRAAMRGQETTDRFRRMRAQPPRVAAIPPASPED